MEHPSKRARLTLDLGDESPPGRVSTPLASLHRSVTPPPSRARATLSAPATPACPDLANDRVEDKSNRSVKLNITDSSPQSPQLVPSLVQLTHIRDFPDHKEYNVDTVKLRDILGDPMIRECWQFNYLFDVDFLMAQFDEDVRNLIQVKVVHGSWEKESANKIRVDEACSRYPNVEAVVAYMPERFGTHHSKMMILLRHDDLAQIVIHTANMIHGDWTNMTQAVWRSPLLPLLNSRGSTSFREKPVFGTGARFKRDLLSYLKVYGVKKTGSLVQQLIRYDFGSIRAALIASVPSKQVLHRLDSDQGTLWGWPALKDLMGRVPIHESGKKNENQPTKKSHIAIQISSVASLGQTDKWLKGTFFNALAPQSTHPPPRYSIIFPTSDEIRRSLDGYGSGGSIHMKTQSAQQQKQLQYIRPHLCHWAGDGPSTSNFIDLSEDKPLKREAGRGRAAPHIKTYIRYSDAEAMNSIDWAMVTSANLSTQAWGAAVNSSGEVRISSWEIGVVFWPELFVDAPLSQGLPDGPECTTAMMIPCFQHDHPSCPVPNSPHERQASTVVGFRMPYNLPLTPYNTSDEPWCATVAHHLPDWRGQTWIV
ncbi:hypothetical protein N7462_011265 [Penicillium macrosclerotiorum]|uniref:uncharacterized protein n=1 Tax=Penicillium macrosclerotiorum TaxID=303699 RepID=UPI0025493AF4|nr:uncharacterized protein N7462_011265 [Penicillium macrosclerotiorum]KAJ5666856.1 hypothetical protein N7462_011265 [Penicillium macrosclerotiorum]